MKTFTIYNIDRFFTETVASPTSRSSLEHIHSFPLSASSEYRHFQYRLTQNVSLLQMIKKTKIKYGT